MIISIFIGDSRYAARYQLAGTLLQRKEDELKQLMSLNFKNLVRFYDSFLENEIDCLLMEYCEVII